jgi:hypothetical protein
MRTEMRAFAAGCLGALILSCLSLNTVGQYSGTAPAPNSGEVYDPWKKTDEQWNRALEKPRSEDRIIKKGLLAPSAEDRADYAAFLKESNTGLIRLLPYEPGNEKLLNIRGGGAYYSFHYLSHEYRYVADLQLQTPLIVAFGPVPKRWLEGIHDMLAVGFGSPDYGMLTNLGNVPLDEFTAKDSRARFLATYDPPRSMPDARCEYRRFVVGETIDGLVYKNRLPVQVGATYLLRSINYDRSDVLVALRVARRDDDGSVIIAWKLLNDFARRRLENINAKSKC